MASWPPPDPRQNLSRVPYLPGLDGLRALAVVAVMVYHANSAWLPGGFLGVEVFFVISGYLITLLLVSEHERNGRVSVRRFWGRRFRRLLPAVFVMMALLAIYMSLFNRRPLGRTRGDFLAGIGYSSNWYQIFVGQGYTAAEAFVPLRHLWSLAVEEQFYVVWPIVMILILKMSRERLPKVALWFFGGSVAIAVAVALLYAGGDIATECSPEEMNGYWRLFGRCISINDALYLGTFSRAGGLLLGAAFAMVWRPVALMRGPMRRKGRLLDLFALVGLAVLWLMMTRIGLSGEGEQFGIRFDPWLFRGGFLVTGLATLLVIAAVTHRRSVIGRVIGNPLFRWVGTRSYGLYLYHWPIYQIIREYSGVPLTSAEFVLALAITVPITELSYRLIELPIRAGRFGEWLRGERRPRTRAAAIRRRRGLIAGLAATSLAVFATMSVVTADNRCVGQQECDNEAALAVLDTTTTTPAASPSTTTPTTQPGEPVPPVVETTTTTTTTIPIELIGPIAIGESVMLGAAPNLIAGGVWVDAAVSRQGTAIAEIVETMRAFGQLGSTVVIHTGTNGSVSNETLDRIMAALPAELTPLVVFLTVKAPRGWIFDNNVRIKALADRYPNVKVVDWEAQALTIESELSGSDGGIHLSTPFAKQFYANMIFTAIGRPDLIR